MFPQGESESPQSRSVTGLVGGTNSLELNYKTNSAQVLLSTMVELFFFLYCSNSC